MKKFMLALAISLGWTQMVKAESLVDFYRVTPDHLMNERSTSDSKLSNYLATYFMKKNTYAIVDVFDSEYKHRPHYEQPILQLVTYRSQIVGFASLITKNAEHHDFLNKVYALKQTSSSKRRLFECTTQKYQDKATLVCIKHDTPAALSSRIYLTLAQHNKPPAAEVRGNFYKQTFTAFAKTDLSKKDAMAYINKYFSVNTPVVRNSANVMAIFKSKEKHLTEINQPLAFLVVGNNVEMLGLASFETDHHDHRVFLNQFNSMRSTGVRLPILNCSTVNTGSTPIRICVQHGLSASKKTVIYADLKKAYATNLSRLDAYR